MEGDKFPIGLKVLVVDDNLPCLKILERQLINCKYKVTATTEAVTALQMLRENKNKFDIVLSDVHMPGMDGFKLLELIGLELDIPVIMLSGSDNPELVMKGVRHGAVDYLVKPARIEELKNIWQHVFRKNQCKQKGKANPDSESDARDDGDNNANLEETRSRKRKEQNSTEDDLDEDDECKDEDEGSNNQKKPRVVWSPELHRKFVAAVDQLGPDKAFPKKILDFMNVDGLTRENVASHLQKYRIYLKRLNSSSNQTTDESIQDPYGVYCSLGSQFNVYSSGSTSHFQHQNNNSTKVGVPSLEDYTRCMENWKNASSVNRPTAQQNMLRKSQLPYNSFNDISYLQNALERTFVDVSSVPDYSFGSQNVSCNIVESNQSFGHNSSVQYNGFFDSPAGQMSVNGTSGFVQNTVQDDEVDALMAMDDSYLLESPELVNGFTQSNGGTLEDLVNGLLK